MSIQQRAGLLSQVCQSLSMAESSSPSCEPDIRIIMSMLCADPFSVESVLGPLLSHQCCFLSGERSLTLETFLGDSKRRVEVVVTSYHTADSFRDDLVHGFILVYSTKRKASLATLVAFSQNIPNLPIQILAVTENGGTANAFFNSELSHQLITAGNAAADRLQAHFMTLTTSTNPKSAVYTPFFKDVWDKKVEIERAFHLEDSAALNDSGEGTLERPVRFGRSHPALHGHPPPRYDARDDRLDAYRARAESNEGSGSEIYERLPTDGSLGEDGEEAVSPTYPDERRLTPSDDSDLYSTLDRPHSQSHSHSQRGKENGEHLVKPSQLKSRQKHPHGWLDDSVFLRRSEMKEDGWGNAAGEAYAHRASTTGRRKMPGSAIPPVPPIPPGGLPAHVRKHNQHLPQHQHPGKLDISNFANVRDAFARMVVTGGAKESGNAPPPPPPRLAKTKDGHGHHGHFSGSYDGDYSYTPLGQDPSLAPSSTKTRSNRYRREKGRPDQLNGRAVDTHPHVASSTRLSAVYSDSDSDWSSPEHRPGAGGSQGSADGTGSRPPRKGSSHKRPRRKRAAIPVATPRVPPLPSALHQTPPPGVPLPLSTRPRGELTSTDKGKLRDVVYTTLPDEDQSSFDVSSPRTGDVGSPLIGFMSRQRDIGGVGSIDHEREQSTQRRRDKAKAKEDEKIEKRRLKEEERQRREREKEKEREKKREQRNKSKSGSKEPTPPATLEDIVAAEGRPIPLFLEKSVRFIEEEGLDSEGIYRVPGNRAHVDILFQKFQEEPNLNIHDLDIAVNAVATALKDFFSKRLPPVLTPEQMDELEEISMTPDRSCRLLALRGLLRKLSTASFDVLKFIFQHFVKVTENCKANSMDSKNLAICWWPTLLPFEFTDMGRFEAMRPHLEDTVQAMIDQFPFLFLGKDEVVMV